MAVTSTNNLKIGSSGDDVLELQKKLNATGYGYNLDEDGIFGNNTLSAVKDYQQRSGLTVDGIVGTNTWGALTKNATTDTTTTAPEETKAPSFEYDAYEKSDVVKQAEALLQQQPANKPGEYQSAWQTQLNETLDKILNREKFSYDLNGDALYQQYKDQYTTQGKMAMMDTMGQAAALTGGYGNSYAQSVGQQAYQGYLQQLNDRIPELYQLALDQYNREGDEMYNQASLMASMEEQDYGRYRDQLSDYYTELDRLTEDSRYQSEMDYGKWADDRNYAYNQYVDDRNFAYQTERDKIADEQWQAQFDEAVRQWEYANKKSSGGGSSTKKTTDSTDTSGGSVTTYAAARDAITALGKNPDAYLMDYEDYQAWVRDGGSGYSSYSDYLTACVNAAKGNITPNTSASLSGFDGNTYRDAYVFATNHGVDSAVASMIYSQSEFNSRNNILDKDDPNYFSSYSEYLKYAVDSMIDSYSK